MKRSGFKWKPRKPLKRTQLKSFAALRSKTPMKRKAKSETRKVQDKLWEECKRITRATYGNTCYTCGKFPLEGSSWQTGHFIPSSVGGAVLRYDLRNLRPQCYRCNIDLSGNGAVFYRKLVEVEGQDYVDALFALKGQTIKALPFYTELLYKYKEM